jgi:hypothetical protein
MSLASTFTSLISGSIISLGSAIAKIIADIPKNIANGNASRVIYEANPSQNDPKAEYNQNLPQAGKQNDLFGSIGDTLRLPQASEWLNKGIPGLNDPKASWNVGTPLGNPIMPTSAPGNLVTPLSIPTPYETKKQAFVAPNVIINGTQMQSPQEVANAVMGAINEAYGKFKEGSLA